MPQVVGLVLIGAGLYAGYCWLAGAAERVSAEMRRAEEELRRRSAEAMGEPRDLGRLEYDPKSGVYKPADRT